MIQDKGGDKELETDNITKEVIQNKIGDDETLIKIEGCMLEPDKASDGHLYRTQEHSLSINSLPNEVKVSKVNKIAKFICMKKKSHSALHN